MASWNEVQLAARAAFVLDRDESNEFAVTVPLQSLGGRAQRVMVRHYEGLDTYMIEVRSAFAEAEDLDPTDVLQDSLGLPLGGIACHGRFLVLVHRVALPFASVDGVMFYITRVAQLADWLESRQGTDRF